jgi:hypothetical protein
MSAIFKFIGKLQVVPKKTSATQSFAKTEYRNVGDVEEEKATLKLLHINDMLAIYRHNEVGVH